MFILRLGSYLITYAKRNSRFSDAMPSSVHDFNCFLEKAGPVVPSVFRRCTSSGVFVIVLIVLQGKKTFCTTMAASTRAVSSSGLSLPKWQIALAIGAPVALGEFC